MHSTILLIRHSVVHFYPNMTQSIKVSIMIYKLAVRSPTCVIVEIFFFFFKKEKYLFMHAMLSSHTRKSNNSSNKGANIDLSIPSISITKEKNILKKLSHGKL